MLVEDTVLIVIGTVLVIVASADAVGTLVTAARHNGRWWPSNVYYRLTGRAWFRVGRRLRARRRETFLNVYGPLSILVLLVLWVSLP